MMMRSLKRMMASGGGGPVDLTAWSFTDFTYSIIPSPMVACTVTLQLLLNGSMVTSGNGGNYGGTSPGANDWYTAWPVTNIGNSYEVRITEITGTFGTGTVGSWVALTSTRTWTITQPASFGTTAVTFDIEIRPNSGSVVSIARCTLSASAGTGL